MALLKAVILAVSAAFYAVSITPPQPRVSGKAVYKGQAYEYIVRYIAYVAAGTFILPTLLQMIVLLNPDILTMSIAPLICHSFVSSEVQLATYTPSFCVGLISLLTGAFLRLSSYRALGSLFTFEVVIQDNHKLVTTGPYSYVRHPAYTGMGLLTLGAYFMHFCSGGYVAECGLETIPALAVVGWAWRITSVFGFLSLYRRCAVEDGKLQKEFGDSWLKYREDVPYAIIPYFL